MIKNDLGFILPMLEANEFTNNICNTAHRLINANQQKQVIIFNNDSTVIDLYGIPLMPVSYAKYFRGDLFVFDLSSLLVTINFPSATNVYFYATNTPWVNSYSNYMAWSKIFNNNRLKVISSNQYLHDIYTITWNNSLGIMEKFSYEQINQYL
jgi:hypothetical protein